MSEQASADEAVRPEHHIGLEEMRTSGDLSVEQMDTFFHHIHDRIHTAMAANPHLHGTEVWERIWSGSQPNLVTLLLFAEHQPLTESEQEALENKAHDIRVALCRNPWLSPLSMARLALGVRRGLQRRESPEKIVEARRALASNPWLTLAVAMSLADDEDFEVRRALAANPQFRGTSMHDALSEEFGDPSDPLLRP